MKAIKYLVLFYTFLNILNYAWNALEYLAEGQNALSLFAGIETGLFILTFWYITKKK